MTGTMTTLSPVAPDVPFVLTRVCCVAGAATSVAATEAAMSVATKAGAAAAATTAGVPATVAATVAAMATVEATAGECYQSFWEVYSVHVFCYRPGMLQPAV